MNIRKASVNFPIKKLKLIIWFMI